MTVATVDVAACDSRLPLVIAPPCHVRFAHLLKNAVEGVFLRVIIAVEATALANFWLPLYELVALRADDDLVSLFSFQL